MHELISVYKDAIITLLGILAAGMIVGGIIGIFKNFVIMILSGLFV